MAPYVTPLLAVIGGSILIGEGGDLFTKPAQVPRNWRMFPLRVLPVVIVSALFLTVTGSVLIALLGGALVLFLLVVGSNLKIRLLNEPLVFTDLTLLAAFVKHPRFYLQAVSIPARCACLIGAVVLCVSLGCASSLALAPRGVGVFLTIASVALLISLLKKSSRVAGVVPAPDVWADVHRYGLLPTVLLYAYRWRHLPALPKKQALPYRCGAPESVVIIQCESWADPMLLNPSWEALPELARSQKEAVQWGDLCPSGLGAYTMRSEYGVLCGESDETLSYRQFDPFLTAQQHFSHALPHTLKAFYKRALFAHPYDLRFYGRDRLVPAWGFTECVGKEHFCETDKVGPYIGDHALTAYLAEYLKKNSGFLSYCVTIENHGPWKKGRLGLQSGAEAWYQHAKHGDAMLGHMRRMIKESGRDIMLVFFGDHRPALHARPVREGLERSTPYVILRPNNPANKGCSSTSNPVNLTPAELHDVIVHYVASGHRHDAAAARE